MPHGTPLASECSSALKHSPEIGFSCPPRPRFLSQMPMISVSPKTMLHSFSFVAQSGSVSAWDEQLSGPNGIQTRELCYARVALGEAENREGVQRPLREMLVPQHLLSKWHCPSFLEFVFKEGQREGVREPSVTRSCEFPVDTLHPLTVPFVPGMPPPIWLWQVGTPGVGGRANGHPLFL